MIKYVGSYSLGQINTMLSAEVLPLLLQIGPLTASVSAQLDSLILQLDAIILQLDLVLTAEFGLGGLKAALSLQFNAAIAAAANIGLAIGNPALYFKGVLTAMLSIIAQLEASLSIGLPTISAQLSAQLSASLSLSAALKAQILGIQILIDASLLVKLPAIAIRTPTLALKAQLDVILPTIQTLAANLGAALSASGGIHLYLLDGISVNVAAELQAAFAANLGVTAGATIKAPLIVIDVAANAQAFAALSSLIKVSDPGEVTFP